MKTKHLKTILAAPAWAALTALAVPSGAQAQGATYSALTGVGAIVDVCRTDLFPTPTGSDGGSYPTPQRASVGYDLGGCSVLGIGDSGPGSVTAYTHYATPDRGDRFSGSVGNVIAQASWSEDVTIQALTPLPSNVRELRLSAGFEVRFERRLAGGELSGSDSNAGAYGAYSISFGGNRFFGEVSDWLYSADSAGGFPFGIFQGAMVFSRFDPSQSFGITQIGANVSANSSVGLRSLAIQSTGDVRARWLGVRDIQAIGFDGAPVALPPDFVFALRGAGSGFDYMNAAPAAVVPEPGTWALMVAGMLAIGAFARRRVPAC